MNPFVLNEFIKDYWLGSGNFYARSVKPTQASRPGGVISTVKIARRYYQPPKTNYDFALFHYFQLGQLPPDLFGIERLKWDTWVNAVDIMKNNDVLISVVVETGMTLTPRDVWLRKTGVDNNFIMAVFQNPNFNYGTILPYLRREDNDGLISTEDGYGIPISTGLYEQQSLDQLDLVVHFYSNSNYTRGETLTKTKSGYAMSYDVANPRNVNEVNNFFSLFKDKLSLGWVNADGFIYTLPAAIKHASEFVSKELGVYQDQTIQKKIFFKLKDAVEYSTKGGLIPNKIFRLEDTELFNPLDVEAFVGVGDEQNFKGVNIDTDATWPMKPVLGYEVTIDTIELLMAKHKFIADNYNDAVVMFVVRRPGIVKNRHYTRHRLDIYDRLPTALKNMFLTSPAHILPSWSLGLFDKDAVAGRLFYDKSFDPNGRDIISTIGLAGMTTLVAKNPILLSKEWVDGKLHQSALVDWGYREELWYRQNQLYLEILPYDMEGKLLDTSYRPANFAGRLHFQNLPQAKCVETHLVKWYSSKLEYHQKIDGEQHILSEDGLFFGYGCYVSHDVEAGIWELAVESVHYTVESVLGSAAPNKIVWDMNRLEQEGLVGRVVEGGRHIHCITYFDSHSNHKDYVELVIQPDEDGLLGIIPANIDVWMDDLLLVEGVDFVVGRGRIFIFMVGESKQSQIRVRMHGLTHLSTHIPPLDVGWVKGGQIVFKETTRRLADKQLKISIGGRVYHRSEVGFGNSSRITDGVMSGEPYMVKEHMVTLENYFNVSTVQTAQADQLIEDEVLAMAALHDPITEEPSFERFFNVRRRRVISGLINTLVYNFLYTERFLKNEIKGNYTKADTDLWLSDFLYLVAVDPTQQSVFNPQYLEVLPHREAYVNLSMLQLKFVQFVNTTYLDGQVNLDNYIIAI